MINIDQIDAFAFSAPYRMRLGVHDYDVDGCSCTQA